MKSTKIWPHEINKHTVSVLTLTQQLSNTLYNWPDFLAASCLNISSVRILHTEWSSKILHVLSRCVQESCKNLHDMCKICAKYLASSRHLCTRNWQTCTRWFYLGSYITVALHPFNLTVHSYKMKIHLSSVSHIHMCYVLQVTNPYVYV